MLVLGSKQGGRKREESLAGYTGGVRGARSTEHGAWSVGMVKGGSSEGGRLGVWGQPAVWDVQAGQGRAARARHGQYGGCDAVEWATAQSVVDFGTIVNMAD